MNAKKAKGYMTLKITLPPTKISRTIVVPENMTLEDLNDAIQSVMGWDNSHLWQFTDRKRDGVIYELPHDDDGFSPFGKRLTLDASKVPLRRVFNNRGAKMFYEYDFGDGWEHVITRMADSKIQEIACVKSEGPDGIEDFGGPWHLANFIESLKNNPDDPNWEDARGWEGLDDEKSIRAFLSGKELEERTSDLKDALRHVKPPESVAEEKPMSEDEKANMLGFLFATIVDSNTWKILEEALRNGGKCEFTDEGETGEFFLTMFEGLKVRPGHSSMFGISPSTLTVLPKWVEWYKTHGDFWRSQHEQADIIEAYASSAVHLYGIVTLDELEDIIRRYDPEFRTERQIWTRMLDMRAINCPYMAYRIEGDRVISDDTFNEGIENVHAFIDDTLRSQSQYPRWYPETRKELFQWESPFFIIHSPELDGLKLVLRTVCGLEDEDETCNVLSFITRLFAISKYAHEIFNIVSRQYFISDLKERQREIVVNAIKRLGDVVRVPRLNGNTPREVRAMEAQKP